MIISDQISEQNIYYAIDEKQENAYNENDYNEMHNENHQILYQNDLCAEK